MNSTADVHSVTRDRGLWSAESLTKMALMVALLSASSYISIPIPFSQARISAGTLVVNVIGLLLAPIQTVVVTVVWILLGLVGVPVFTGGTAGPAKLFGPVGGYFVGWVVAAWLIAMFCRVVKNEKWQLVFLIAAGIPVIYLFGAVWYKFVTAQPWGPVILQTVVPFIPLDIVKCIAAMAIAKALRATHLF